MHTNKIHPLSSKAHSVVQRLCCCSYNIHRAPPLCTNCNVIGKLTTSYAGSHYIASDNEIFLMSVMPCDSRRWIMSAMLLLSRPRSSCTSSTVCESSSWTTNTRRHDVLALAPTPPEMCQAVHVTNKRNKHKTRCMLCDGVQASTSERQGGMTTDVKFR